MTLFGTYAGNYAGSVDALAAYIGRDPDLASVHVGQGSWSDIEGSADYAIWANLWKRSPFCVTVPLCPNGETLVGMRDGQHNGSFQIVAQKIKAKLLAPNDDKPVQPIVYVRLGQEFNLSGLWPWSVGLDVPRPNSAADYAAAFRQVAGVFRAVDSRFRLVWCPNVGWQDPWPSYPGDDVVDVVGLDMYSHPGDYGEPVDALANWAYQCALPFGPGWLAGFGKSRGKPICFPEWGIRRDDYGPYVQAFHDWCLANDVLYANYWDSDGDYHGCISNGSLPTAGALFRTCFGSAAPPAAAPLPPTSPAPKEKAMPHTINLHMSEDAYQGDAIAAITLDGVAQTPVTVTAKHGHGPSQVVPLTVGPGTHTLAIAFTNDAWGGSSDKDRNLYLDGADVDGVDAGTAPAGLFSNGSVTRTVTVPYSAADLDALVKAMTAVPGFVSPFR